MSALPFETGGEQATVDRLFWAVATEERRDVLDYFEASADKTASLADLTDALGARRDGANTRSREQIRVRLHHVDLPKLAAVGVIDYDARTTTARYHGHARLERTEERWTLVTEQGEEP